VGVATPAAAASLAAAVARRDGLRFGGFLTYPAPDGAQGFLSEAAGLAEANGLAVETISAGGTPAMWASAELRPTVTEYRVGTYAFHDRASVAAGAATLDEVALTVRATVVSRPRSDSAILDAGSKALSHDPGPGPGYGTILEAPASIVERLGEEHAIVALASGDALELGQQVRIVPNHVCVVVNLADELVLQGDGLEAGVWRVDARGRSR
jgi:D-serine deaminase-like pyridoxal phosphate-dependent protein